MHRFVAVAGLADDENVFLLPQGHHYARTVQRVVVCNDNGHGAHVQTSLPIGTVILTVVPAFLPVMISNVPPMLSMRS